VKRYIVLSLLLAASSYAFGAKVVRIVREPMGVNFSIEKGYGVQKDGKHELTFISMTSGMTLKHITSFKGKIAVQDKKYFDRLESVEIPRDTGKIRVTGRIFYCSFEQKFCSVQKINEEI